MLTPFMNIFFAVTLNAAAPQMATRSFSSGLKPFVLGRCVTETILHSGKDFGHDISPLVDAEWYFYQYTSPAFRKIKDVDNSLNHPAQAHVEILVSPKFGKLLDRGDPGSGQWYIEGIKGKHFYRYVPDKGHEKDSDRFTVRVKLKLVRVDIRYQIKAVPTEDRPDEYCPREQWRISYSGVQDANASALASAPPRVRSVFP